MEINEKTFHEIALDYRSARTQDAAKCFEYLEQWMSKACIDAGERWRDEWSDVCNENQILSNTCDEALAEIKELIAERNAYKSAIEGLMYWDNGKSEYEIARELLRKSR